VGSKRVLVVEDDAISRLSVRRILERALDVSVHDAGSVAQAIELTGRQRFDLLITDILLGDGDGVAAAQQILSFQEASLIFITALTDEKTRARADELRPNGFLSKPVDEQELLDAIRSCFEKSTNAPSDRIDSNFVLQTLYDTAQIGMCITDEERRFVHVNRAYCSTYGYPAQQLMGKEFTLVLPPEDRIYAADMHDQFIAGTISEIPARWRVQTSSGELRDIFVTAGRMIGNDGKPYKVTTVSDITKQLRHEQELESALEEKRMLLREVHHRVKNNLNTLSSLLHLQRDQHQEEPLASELLTVTINRVKTMSSIYERLHETKGRATVSLHTYLSGLAADLVGTGESGLNIELKCTVEPMEVDIDDAISCGLIANELITNCLKHAFPNGSAGRIELDVKSTADRTVIRVSDDGPGLPSGFSLGESNSLGLQLVQALVGQLEGTIEATSNGGACFTARVRPL
jgi:PAS domain S-box-containing protein